MQSLEQSWVGDVVKHLRREGITATWRTPGKAAAPFDGELHVQWPGGQYAFPTVVRSRLAPGTVGLLPSTAGVLITEAITPAVRRSLENAGWGYADRSGNASLTAPGLLVRVDGRRPRTDSSSPVHRPFTRSGLPVTFAVIVRDGLKDTLTQRELADLVASSLGTTNRVLRSLRELGYLTERGEISKRALLVERWTESYLSHRAALGDGRTYTSDRWSTPTAVVAGAVPGVRWGSEVAAHLQGRSIRPASVLAYCSPEARKDMIRMGRMRPVADGWIELRETFWGPDLLLPGEQTVPDVLIRADLIATADPRLAEVARAMT